MSNLSAVSWHEQVTFDEMMMSSVLIYCEILIVYGALIFVDFMLQEVHEFTNPKNNELETR